MPQITITGQSGADAQKQPLISPIMQHTIGDLLNRLNNPVVQQNATQAGRHVITVTNPPTQNELDAVEKELESTGSVFSVV